jgi:hypothetical protein
MAVAFAMLAFAAAAEAAPQQVLYVGDSLGVGTTPLLARELGSSAHVHGDSRIGRPSGEGLRILGQSIGARDGIVVFDLGTNDDPARPAALAADLAAARRASGDRCMIVATLNRPPLGGVSVDGLNQAVLAFASAKPNIQLVDWNAIAQSEPGVLGPDHVHPTPQGYALRAELFAEAVAACSAPPPDQGDSLAPPAPASKAKPKRRKRAVKVPGIESSGISFTEPVRVRGLNAQLLLPNTKPPYPAVVMLGGTQKAAEFLAAHGIATLTWAEHGSARDARAAVALLAKRDDVRHSGIGVWALGDAGARVAARNKAVAALVAVSPVVVAKAEQRDWQARRHANSPAVTTWLRTRGDDSHPASAWKQVDQPVLAIWGTRDNQMPIRASAEALRRTLGAAGDRDRTFRWFDAPHEPASAPGMLEEAARWLGLHLGEQRAKPVIQDALPPANPGPELETVSDAAAIYRPPLQAIWLLAPALMLAAAAIQARRASAGSAPSSAPGARRLAIAALAAGIGCAACTAAGIALALDPDGGAVKEIAGQPWPFALAFAFAVAVGACAVASARRRAWLSATACGLWLALALFWLL